MVTGLGLALLLNAKVPGIGIFRTILFVPSILAGVAVAVLWLQILSPETGILNQVLRGLGVQNPPRWLASPDWAVPAVVLTGLWTVGGGAIIYLAGLQNIPAAPVRGRRAGRCGLRSRFRNITLPMLSPTLFFVFITTLIGAFQVFDVAFVLGGSRGRRGRSPLLPVEPLERGIPERPLRVCIRAGRGVRRRGLRRCGRRGPSSPRSSSTTRTMIGARGDERRSSAARPPVPPPSHGRGLVRA